MNADEFTRIRLALQMNCREMADALGSTKSMVSRYENSLSNIPRPVALLMLIYERYSGIIGEFSTK